MATARTKKAPAPRADLLEKDPTELHSDFAEWLKETTGYEVDEKTVQLATILRMDFQRSDKNQSRLAASKEAKESAEQEREAKRQERAEAKAAREAEKAEKAAAKAAQPKKEPAAKKAAPAKKAPATKTAAAAKKSAPARRRRPAAAASEAL